MWKEIHGDPKEEVFFNIFSSQKGGGRSPPAFPRANAISYWIIFIDSSCGETNLPQTRRKTMKDTIIGGCKSPPRRQIDRTSHEIWPIKQAAKLFKGVTCGAAGAEPRRSHDQFLANLYTQSSGIITRLQRFKFVLGQF